MDCDGACLTYFFLEVGDYAHGYCSVCFEIDCHVGFLAVGEVVPIITQHGGGLTDGAYLVCHLNSDLSVGCFSYIYVDGGALVSEFCHLCALRHFEFHFHVFCPHVCHNHEEEEDCEDEVGHACYVEGGNFSFFSSISELHFLGG